MNRRGFLKGAGAMATTPLVAKLSGIAAWAQAPMYEGEAIYTFSEFAGAEYDFLTDGAISNVSENGVIVGRDRVGGQQVPCTWDLAGTRTVLETGDIAYASVGPMVTSPNGSIAGTFGLSLDDTSQRMAVSWAGGAPVVLPADGATNTAARAIDDSGAVAGSLATQGARWTGGSPELLALPEGAGGSSIHCIGPNASIPGLFLDGNLGILGTPWRWNPDGTVDDLGWPSDLIDAAPEAISGLTSRVSRMFDNGDFVLSAGWRNGELWSQRSWSNSGGSYAAITSDGADVPFLALHPQSLDRMLGLLSLPGGSFDSAVWANGVLSKIADVSVLPDGVSSLSVVGATKDGIVVGTAQTAEGIPQILALRPV